MSQISNWLSGGDLRSDGMADEAAEFILQNPEFLDDLFSGLYNPDEVIRGRTADALEKVARERPDLFSKRTDELISIAKNDPVPMVRWHVAMIFGHLACEEGLEKKTVPVLLVLLEDESVFVKSWAIVSLCILARMYPVWNEPVLNRITSMHTDPSTAIRTKVRYAMGILTDESATFPKGWIKGKHIGET